MSQPEQYKFNPHDEVFTGTRSIAVTDPKTDVMISINVRDGMWAVDVKDRDILADLPQSAQDAIAKLGEDTTHAIYNESVERFWEWAREAAQEHDFPTVHAAGRSGGWMAVDGTQDWSPAELLQPREDFRDQRDAFLALAFEAVAEMMTFRKEYWDNLVPAAAVAGAFPAGAREPIQVLAVLWSDDDGANCDLYRNKPALLGALGTHYEGAVNLAMAEPGKPAVFDGDEGSVVRYLAVVE